MQNIGISHPIIKDLKHNTYTKQGYFIVDDLFILSLEKCKKSNVQLCIICPDELVSEQALQIAEFYQTHYPTYSVSKKTYEAIASKQNCAGILIVTSLTNTAPTLHNHHTIIVCDGIENSGNIGTILRTADASNIDLVIFTNIKAKVNDIKSIRASRGTIFTTPFIILDNLQDTIQYLNKQNSQIIICEPEQGINYNEFDYSGNIALVVGSERYGVSPEWFDLPNNKFIKIPMKSNVGSLNVGVATSIIAYQAQISKNKF